MGSSRRKLSKRVKFGRPPRLVTGLRKPAGNRFVRELSLGMRSRVGALIADPLFVGPCREQVDPEAVVSVTGAERFPSMSAVVTTGTLTICTSAGHRVPIDFSLATGQGSSGSCPRRCADSLPGGPRIIRHPLTWGVRCKRRCEASKACSDFPTSEAYSPSISADLMAHQLLITSVLFADECQLEQGCVAGVVEYRLVRSDAEN